MQQIPDDLLKKVSSFYQSDQLLDKHQKKLNRNYLLKTENVSKTTF